MQELTVTAKGRTTLPKHVRVALALMPGDRVRYLVLDGGEVRIVRCQPIGKLAGLLKDRADGPVGLDDMEEASARGAVE